MVLYTVRQQHHLAPVHMVLPLIQAIQNPYIRQGLVDTRFLLQLAHILPQLGLRQLFRLHLFAPVSVRRRMLHYPQFYLLVLNPSLSFLTLRLT